MVPAAERSNPQLTRPSKEVVDMAFQMFWSALAPLRKAGKLGMVAFQFYTESDAIFQVLARLGPPCSWIAFLPIIPRRVRDACYRLIVRRRYQWFGRTDVCPVP